MTHEQTHEHILTEEELDILAKCREANKKYLEGFGQYIDDLTDDELMELLEETGLNDCSFEDEKEETNGQND